MVLAALVVLTVGVVVAARAARATGAATALDDASAALVAMCALALLGIPATLRRGRRRRSGIEQVDVMTGEAFEARLALLFADLGEQVCHTGRRGDFGADLVTERGGVRTVVQAKRYEGAVGIEAVQQAIGARGYYDAARARVVTNSFLTPAALALARADDVEVVERDGLVTLLASNPDADHGQAPWVLCRQIADGAVLAAYALYVGCRLVWRVLRIGLRAGRRVLGGA